MQQGSQLPPAGSRHASEPGAQPAVLNVATKIGDNLAPVPPKLTGRIIRGEFVAMHELLPECLADTSEANKPTAMARAKRRVQDINTWLQCFAVYVGVVGPARPSCVPQMMSYMVTIIRRARSLRVQHGSFMTMRIDTRQRQPATGSGRR